jgi:hypothetical protein
MRARVVFETVVGILDHFLFSPVAPEPRPPEAGRDRIATLRNGQMLLPGIAEPSPWQFSPEA